MEWALEQISQRVKATRDADFTTRDEQGRLLNAVRSIGSLGGATIDNEENYLIKKLLGGGLGSAVDREPGANMTQRLGARSGRLVRPRRGHELSAGHGQ